MAAALLIANRQKISVALSAKSQAEIPVQTTDSNILIVYFTQAENVETDAISSASVAVIDGVAKGNVKAIADMIQEKTNADLYSIQSEKKYSSSWETLTDDAKNEQDENILPALASHIQNFEQYDTIFIGYPTWWYDMPQVMYTFFEEYDFSDKKIIPFNSANGSQFSGTIHKIQQFEPNADVVTDGLSVHQNSVPTAQNDVNNWLNQLGY